MFWVEIPGRRGLVSLPFPGKNSCLSRDFWQVEIGFSTHFAGFPCFGQRFPDGGAWNLYLFPAKTAVQVEISGRRGLVSLPISPVFAILGRDFRQAEFGFSTHFAGFPCFRQRFPAGRAWFLYLFPAKTTVRVEISDITPHNGAPHRSTPHHGTPPPRRIPPRHSPPQHAPPRHTPPRHTPPRHTPLRYNTPLR